MKVETKQVSKPNRSILQPQNNSLVKQAQITLNNNSQEL